MTRAEAERRERVAMAICEATAPAFKPVCVCKRDGRLPGSCNGRTCQDSLRAADAVLALPDTGEADGWRQTLGFGEIVMMSEQRNRPGLPPRWCALARGRKEAAMGDSEEEARIAALALPNTGEG